MKPSDEYGGTGVTLGWEVEKKDLGSGNRTRIEEQPCR